ncbi:MAG: hypothetical protein NVSMB10_10270 [Steroidobacteraceae bacterium]
MTWKVTTGVEWSAANSTLKPLLSSRYSSMPPSDLMWLNPTAGAAVADGTAAVAGAGAAAAIGAGAGARAAVAAPPENAASAPATQSAQRRRKHTL